MRQQAAASIPPVGTEHGEAMRRDFAPRDPRASPRGRLAFRPLTFPAEQNRSRQRDAERTEEHDDERRLQVVGRALRVAEFDLDSGLSNPEQIEQIVRGRRVGSELLAVAENGGVLRGMREHEGVVQRVEDGMVRHQQEPATAVIGGGIDDLSLRELVERRLAAEEDYRARLNDLQRRVDEHEAR